MGEEEAMKLALGLKNNSSVTELNLEGLRLMW